MDLPALSQPPRMTSAPPTSNPPESEHTPKLALVTSHATTSEILQPILEEAGYEVVLLEAGESLFATIHSSTPDLVLLDANIDVASPFELCGEIRATKVGRFMPLVLVSMQEAPEEIVAAGLMAGADDFCCPGDRPTEFMARVRVQLRQKRVRDRLRRVRSERDHYMRASKVDPLTGLLNRGSFDAVLGEAMTGEASFAILFIDVDHFKAINDNLGHETGDEVLRRIAKCIDKSARGHDRCGRYGGEEFVVLIAGVDQTIALAVAERHRRNIEAIQIPGLPTGVSASVGVAVFDPTRPDLSRQALYRRADTALYRAKDAGRNRVMMAAGPGERSRANEPAIALVARAPVAPPPDSRTRPVAVSSMEAIASPPQASTPPVEDDLEARLLRAMSHRAGLPLLPEAAAQALTLARDPSSDMPRIAKLVDRDPTLAARFIALANSPLYSYGNRVVSTHAALVRLGLATSRDLLLQVVYERSKGGLKRYQAEVELCFRRSVIAALAAVDIARSKNVLFEDAYLCGLLHDLGEGRVYRVLSELGGNESKEAAKALVERHHPHAGAEVARTWGLPQPVIDACECHHDDAGNVSERVRIVMVADCVADAAVAAVSVSKGFSESQRARLDALGFDVKLANVVLQGVSVAGRLVR